MVSKYWFPTGTCHSTNGSPVSVWMRLMKASQREKFGKKTLLRSHQCGFDAAPYQAASWSATSLKIRSQGVMPPGFPTSPALLRNATTLSASVAGLTVERWSLAMSTPLAQLLAWMASRALGAYLSRSFKNARPIPATVLGRPARSGLPELATTAARVVGSALCCSMKPQKSGSTWTTTGPPYAPTFCIRTVKSAQYACIVQTVEIFVSSAASLPCDGLDCTIS